MGRSEAVTEWLLDESQPPVRYLALRELLGKGGGDSDVKEAYGAIPERGWAREILDLRGEDGMWGGGSLYWPKYRAANWMLLILSDLGMERDSAVIDAACRTWIDKYSAQDGGFAASSRGGAKHGHLCITGNTARALVKFGYEEHPSVRSAFEWFVKYQSELGGWSCFDFGTPRKGRNLDSWEPLSAFAAYPRQKWNRGMKLAVERGAEFFLERELHVQGKRYEPWYRFHYPNHYYYDVLVGLDLLTALGYGDDSRLSFALSLLRKKRRRDGKWLMDSINPDPESPQGLWNVKHQNRAAVPFALEEAGKPSRMVTLTAMKVLRRIGEE